MQCEDERRRTYIKEKLEYGIDDIEKRIQKMEAKTDMRQGNECKEMAKQEGEGELQRMMRDMVSKIEREFRERIENLRQEMESRERQWRQEKENIGREIAEIRKAIREQVKEREVVTRLKERVDRIELEEVNIEKEGLNRLAWKVEMNERKEKRRNIVIRRLEKRGEAKEEVRVLLEERLGVKPDIEEIKEVGGGKIVVTLKREEDKREIMWKKRH